MQLHTESPQMTDSFIDPKMPYFIRRYSDVLAHLAILWRTKHNVDMPSGLKPLADEITKTGIIVRAKWLGDLKAGGAIQYKQAHSVFTGTNNLLKKLGGPEIPADALMPFAGTADVRA